MPKASRVDDTIAHSNALLGLVGGMVIGAAIGVAVVATGGVAAIALAAAAGAATGAGIGEVIGRAIMQNTGEIATGAERTQISHRLAARAVEDMVDCHTGQVIAQGSRTVFIEDFPASRIGDKTQCDGTISSGSANVEIGLEPGTFVNIVNQDVPLWLRLAVEVLGVVSPIRDSRPRNRTGSSAVHMHSGPSQPKGDPPSRSTGTTNRPNDGTDAPEKIRRGPGGEEVQASEATSGAGRQYNDGKPAHAGQAPVAPPGISTEINSNPRSKAEPNPTPSGRTSTTRDSLIQELTQQGLKHTPGDIVAIEKINNRIVFIETGNDKAGLEHIIKRHGKEFEAAGIEESQIPDILMAAARQNTIVGDQRGRPIYEVFFNGERKYVAVTIADNGFIVGANMSSNRRHNSK